MKSDKMGSESMSSLAGRATQTEYMAGGSQSPIEMGPQEGWPSGNQVKTMKNPGSQTDTCSESSSEE